MSLAILDSKLLFSEESKVLPEKMETPQDKAEPIEEDEWPINPPENLLIEYEEYDA